MGFRQWFILEDMPRFYHLISGKGWSAADVKRIYDLPFLITDIDDVLEGNEGRHELTEEFNEELEEEQEIEEELEEQEQEIEEEQELEEEEETE